LYAIRFKKDMAYTTDINCCNSVAAPVFFSAGLGGKYLFSKDLPACFLFVAHTHPLGAF
jgi:hypothetical protein